MTQMQGKLIKYPKIYHIGSPEIEELLTIDDLVCVQTKCDGANARVVYDKEKDILIFGSRNRKLELNEDLSNWKFINVFKLAFLKNKNKFVPGYEYICESMQKHTLIYDNIPDVIGLDIINLSTNEFLYWKDSKKMFEDIGIDFVHVHFERSGSDITINELKELIKTSIYRHGKDEGVVLKCYSRKSKFGNPLFGKLIDIEFKEKNKTIFKGETPEVITNDSEIVNEYFTNGRFIKAINYFKDNNEVINMSLMPKLFKYISDDILSENILDIAREYNSIEFKKFNNIIAGKSSKMLKEYLINEVKIC